VVWRPRRDGEVEVAVVHRPRYDDWSLPKGKVEGDETELATARREVEEETGLRCDTGPELRSSRYIDGKGRHKTVRYWAMTPVESTPDDWEFVPNKEVDRLRWVTPAQAERLVSYDRDRKVLRSFRPPVTGRR
jgi:8-oxo-dGTP pyrophosphatase MutT (NUDIX family)